MTQLRTIQKMGPIQDVMAKLPMFGSMADKADESEIGKVQSLIDSMTREERKQPEIINKSRAARIAGGSGRKTKDVTDLVSRFEQMRKMMGSLGKPGGLLSRIPGMGGMSGAGGMDPSALMAGAGMGDMPMGGTVRMRSEKTQQRRKNKRQQARKSRQKSRGKKKKK
jgi:signal recognition particle subunit SRP54